MSPRPPTECTEMAHVRAEIDRIDAALVDLVSERFGYVDRAWQIKQHGPEGAIVPWRIQQVIDKVKLRAAERGLPPELAEALWRQMIGWFIQYEEERLRQASEASGSGTTPREGNGT
ncbi:MAG: chorismate mutase [Hyphomicrobiaceae bacterium]|nr:chorismate mutase [Hyphomicrobiaceae bacterium]